MVLDQSINQLYASLEGTGFYGIVLPFILVFAIIYGLLSKVAGDIFGEGSKAPALISAALAFYAVYSGIIGSFMTAFTGPWALGLVLVLALLIAGSLAGLTPGDNERWGQLIGVLAIGGTALLIWMEGGVAQVFGTNHPIAATFGSAGGINWATIIILGIAIAAVAWMIGLFDSR